MTGRHRAHGRPCLRYVVAMLPGAAAAAVWGQPNVVAPTAVAVPQQQPVVVAAPHPPRAVRMVRRATGAEVAVHAALAKVGDPYVWGAKGPDAFDCSGLTRWAWAQAGVPLGMDTYRQLTNGYPVGTVQAGDLVFPHPGHVLLAISPTRAVEAPGRGLRVRVVPMPAHYTARRVV